MGAGSITCIIPASVPYGKRYRIRITGSMPNYISNDNGVDIEIAQTPPKPIATGDTLLCTGDTLHLYASGSPNGYTWTGPGFLSLLPNPVIPNVSLRHAGKYIVFANPSGCKIADTLDVTINRTPAKPEITHNSPVCTGETLEFSFQPDTSLATNYEWYTPDSVNDSLQYYLTIDSVTAGYTGRYIVTASLGNCMASDTAWILIKPLPIITASSNSPLPVRSQLKLSAVSDSAKSYLWTGPENYSSREQNPVISDVTSFNEGEYTVRGTNNGCTDSATTVVEITDLGDDYVILFPNPNDGKFTLIGNVLLDQTMQMVVINSTGQEIYRTKAITDRQKLDHTVVLPAVANGNYFLQLRISGKERTIPFTVER